MPAVAQQIQDLLTVVRGLCCWCCSAKFARVFEAVAVLCIPVGCSPYGWMFPLSATTEYACTPRRQVTFLTVKGAMHLNCMFARPPPKEYNAGVEARNKHACMHAHVWGFSTHQTPSECMLCVLCFVLCRLIRGARAGLPTMTCPLSTGGGDVRDSGDFACSVRSASSWVAIGQKKCACTV